jgi:hydrogenase maturation protease
MREHAGIATPPAMSTVVVGVGNPDRGDDAVGWRVVELLEGSVPACVSAGDPASLIDAFCGHERVIIVDASATGVEPGTVHVGSPSTTDAPAVTSSHGFGVEQAVALGAALDVLPDELIVVAIEGGRFDHGAPLTPEVESTARRVAAMLKDGTLPTPDRDQSPQ